MPAPDITPLPDAPLRSDNPPTFSAKAEAWVDAIDGFTDELNAFGDYLDGYVPGSNLSTPTWDFNFSDTGDAYIRASVAMTITQQATTGTGTVAYEKSTAAAPDTFAGATSPITLEAGAKLKVSASEVTGTFAIHLERTA